MTKHHYDLIIIGGGSAGLSLCSAAAQMGVKVCLIDKAKLGGDCLHYGCVPSKALIKSGKVAHLMETAETYGLKSHTTKLNWADVTKRIANIQAKIQKHDHPDRFRAYGADIAFGAASFVDKHTLKITLNPKLKSWQQPQFANKKTKTITGKKICIATGSRPRVPNIDGLETAGFITNEDLFSLKSQPKSMAIIGGGVIATELAQAMQRLGTQVTILEAFPNFMGRFDEDVAQLMTKKIEAEGVEIITGAETQSVEKKGNKKVINFKIKNKLQALSVDEILVATGRAPNTDLNLEKAGIIYSDRGIKVNQKCQTNLRHITAIGDVNGQAPFTHAANYEAGVVFTNDILGIPAKTDYTQIGWTIYTDPEVAQIGLDEANAKRTGIKFKVQKFALSGNDRALAESESEGFVKILVGKKDRVLGAQIVAPRAGEMIREWQLIIANKMPLSKVARSTYIYPTFGEANKWIASQYLAPKLFNPKVKKIFRALRGFRGKI